MVAEMVAQKVERKVNWSVASMVAWTVVWRAEQKGLLSVELMGVMMVDVMVLHWAA